MALSHRTTPLLATILVYACSPARHDEVGSIDEPVTGLVAAYAFDEASGATTADSSSNHLTGTLSNVTRVAGKSGGGIKFAGSNASWVTVADAAPLHLAKGMTLEAWVNPSSLSG